MLRLENVATVAIKHVEEAVVHALRKVRGLPVHGQHLTASLEHGYRVEVGGLDSKRTTPSGQQLLNRLNCLPFSTWIDACVLVDVVFS